MAVLVTADVPGQTEDGYRKVLGILEGFLKSSPGFVLHTAHPVEGGLRVIEVWRSKAESDEFFSQFVAPNLPPGIHPKRTVQELSSVVHL